MNLSTDQVRAVADIIGAGNHAKLGAELEEILSIYQDRRRFGRDTFPTPAEAHQTSIEIEKRLAWIMDALRGQEQNPFLAIWLSGALTENDNGPMFEFPEAVMQLLRVVRKVNDDFERNTGEPFEVGGTPHRRKTRTEARDTVLIPALILCAQVHGNPDLVGGDDDYEALDTICEFLTATMNAVGVAAPDAGNTLHGEVAQGRLRRMVKDNIKRFREMRENDA